jgi:GTP-binding protein
VDVAALKAGERLFRSECRFTRGATKPPDFPEETLPEIAFAGRSNVGKSSLINALTFRKKLARASNTPGRTQQINFFDLGGRICLVDLPGYGFAAASKEKTAAWTGLIRTYLKHRENLVCVCLLIDARHGFKESDLGALGYLGETDQRALIVLTKCDKIKPPALAALKEEMEEGLRQYSAAYPQVYETSADKGTGIPELRSFLAENA